jgi:hypothetical protein
VGLLGEVQEAGEGAATSARITTTFLTFSHTNARSLYTISLCTHTSTFLNQREMPEM